jgi:hypothetical protein
MSLYIASFFTLGTAIFLELHVLQYCTPKEGKILPLQNDIKCLKVYCSSGRAPAVCTSIIFGPRLGALTRSPKKQILLAMVNEDDIL